MRDAHFMWTISLCVEYSCPLEQTHSTSVNIKKGNCGPAIEQGLMLEVSLGESAERTQLLDLCVH